MVICLERSANDLQMVWLMPLPPHHLCFNKIQNGLSFWYRPTQVVLEKRLLNDCMCVCMCVCVCNYCIGLLAAVSNTILIISRCQQQLIGQYSNQFCEKWLSTVFLPSLIWKAIDSQTISSHCNERHQTYKMGAMLSTSLMQQSQVDTVEFTIIKLYLAICYGQINALAGRPRPRVR